MLPFIFHYACWIRFSNDMTTLVAQSKTVVFPLLMHCRYHSLVLSYRHNACFLTKTVKMGLINSLKLQRLWTSQRGTHFTNNLWAHQWNLIIFFLLTLIFNHPIRSQICSCHDSWAVVTCAILRLDLITVCQVRATHFYKIWLSSSQIISMG